MPRKRNRRRPERAYKLQQQPNKKWRVVSYDPVSGSWVSSSMALGLGRVTFAARTEAKEIGERADALLNSRKHATLSVAMLRDRWLARPWKKESTERINTARTKGFAEVYGDIAAGLIDESHWLEYQIQHGGRPSHLEGLKAMFSWATTTEGGRILDHSPFADLKLGKGSGNEKKNPPTEAEVERMIAVAYEQQPLFGAWLEFACYSGLRPSEIDALRWIDLVEDGEVVQIRRQWSPHSRTFTLPKNGQTRDALLLPRALKAIDHMRRISWGRSEFIFVNTRENHWTSSAREPYWKRVRDAVRWDDPARAAREFTLYLCTRHFAGSFMRNRLEMESQDIAEMLGHTDGGQLVRVLYGHSDARRAQRRVVDAYKRHEQAQRSERKRRMSTGER